MGTVHVVLSVVDTQSAVGGDTMPVAKSVPYQADTVTTSASSAVSNITAPQPTNGLFWDVTAKDVDVYVAFGPGTPVAGAETGWLVTAGQSRQWAVTAASEKIALKDA